MRAITMGMILACAAFAGPVRAEDACAAFSRKYDLVEQEHQDAIRELNQVNAMTPTPKKDAGLCLAVRKFANDVPYLSNAPAGCFEKPDDAKTFSDQLMSYMSSSGTLAGFYCTDEELRSSVTSKVNSCALTGC